MTHTPSKLCTDLELRHGVLESEDTEYQTRQEAYWSSTSKLDPACILRPISAQEVSIIVKAFARTKQPFAVRAGGHMQWAGANNIGNGVQIDLCFLNWIKIDKDAGTVDIGPGAQWKEVYAAVEKDGLMVAGGRNGKVGVGGLLLGGGKTFFTGRRGFACDDVVEYEVVLADGSITTASAQQNPDLFFVLKGGSNNFGIVTNFKMRSFEHEKIWGGLKILPRESIAKVLQSFEEFTSNTAADPDSALILFLAKMPDQAEVHAIAAMINVEGVENALSYSKFLDMPAVMDSSKMTTVKTIVSEYDPVPSGWYNYFYNISVKNDIRIYQKAAELHELLVQDLKSSMPEGDFLTECLFQPLPKSYGQVSVQKGGNVMGVSNLPADGCLFVAIIVVKTAEQGSTAHLKLRAWGQAVKEYAVSVDGLLPWIYMNYADSSQNVLRSYGEDNVQKMRATAAKFDPAQVFQELCPGGFKISQA